MRYEVIVELKEEVLDTQGRAIQHSLQRLGHTSLQAVKVSKRFLLEIEGSEAQAEELAKKVAMDHLANSVAETFLIRKL